MKKQENQQFLTARMSAAAALLSAYETTSAHSTKIGPFRLAELQFKSRRLRQGIAILFQEADLGFEGDGWDLGVERRAIDRHLATYFFDAHQIIGRVDSTPILEGAFADIQSEIETLTDFIQGRHAELKRTLDEIKANLCRGLPTDSSGKIIFSAETWKRTRETVEKRLGELLERYPGVLLSDVPAMAETREQSSSESRTLEEDLEHPQYWPGEDRDD